MPPFIWRKKMPDYRKRAKEIAESECKFIFKKSHDNYEITEDGVIVFDKNKIHKETQLSAFPVEQKMKDAKLNSLALQHWFRYLHALKLAKPGDIVLDIGSGPCNIGYTLYRNFKKVIYFAVDLDYKRLAQGIDKGFGKEMYFFIQLDISRKTLPFINNQFDIIFCYEMIEHVTKDLSLRILENALTLLNQDGVISLATPNKKGGKVEEKFKKYKTHGKSGVYETHPHEWNFISLLNKMDEMGYDTKDYRTFGCDVPHISVCDDYFGSYALYKAIRNYFPSQICRMICATALYKDSSFLLIDAKRK